jgi:hypothetical protein
MMRMVEILLCSMQTRTLMSFNTLKQRSNYMLQKKCIAYEMCILFSLKIFFALAQDRDQRRRVLVNVIMNFQVP